MKTRLMLVLGAAIATAAPTAHAGKPEVLQVSPDVFMVIVKNHAGAFGQPSTTKKKAIQAANDYAAERGMVAVPVHMAYTEAAPGRFPAAEYQFRLARPGEATSAAIAPEPDVHVHVSAGASGIPEQAQAQPHPDLYTELTKLDDLRRRGLLTDAEFEAEKQKLLQR